jgi:hypothetical protein
MHALGLKVATEISTQAGNTIFTRMALQLNFFDCLNTIAKDDTLETDTRL